MISAVILAAGSSTRLGRPKQLVALGGVPALQHVVDAAAEAGIQDIVVVLGHAGEEVSRSIRLPPQGRFVTNPDHAGGQSTSLRAGLASISEEARAVVVLLGDQPGVRVDAISAVVDAWRQGKGPVVQASYRGRRAHPTLLDRSMWREVQPLTGDEGARNLLAAHPDWVRTAEIEGEPPDDLDTEEDYARIRRGFEPR